MNASNKMNRRKFVNTAATASLAFSIVPRHVLGGQSYVAPSDKLTIAYIGCGTQGLREMVPLIANPKVQIVAVCDPNKRSDDYIDWSRHGIRDTIRKALGDSTWAEGVEGILGGREVGQAFVEKYYARNKPSGKYKGCPAYADYRELLERESGVDALKVMTPDHLHAAISLAGMKKGKHIVMHKPIANRMHESRVTIDVARRTGVGTHLLAWSERPGNQKVKQWIAEGAIGTLKEIHNWSYRPVWPQWPSVPDEKPPVPADFDWQLWLGPERDRPYHPHYTHCVFRGWYDFGGGSIADMGHYSLWPMFLTLGVNTPPLSAEAYATTNRTVVDQVSRPINNDVSFPYSCIIRFKFPAQETLPAFDLFWYDGGMKPHTAEELEVDGKDMPSEGMMFVGDKGKILGGFRNEDPVLIPESRMRNYPEEKTETSERGRRGDDVWIDPFREGKQTPGSFLLAGAVSETINLGAIALRAGGKVVYDAARMEITNNPDANRFLRRDYRPGWEL